MIFANATAYARWATPEDNDKEVSLVVKIDIKQDLGYEKTCDMRAKILRESARDALAHYTEIYDGQDTFTVLEASTINEDATYQVDKHFIEDKPIGNKSNTYSTNR